jgi:hypothetical protein
LAYVAPPGKGLTILLPNHDMANSPGLLDSQLARHGPIPPKTPLPVKRIGQKYGLTALTFDEKLEQMTGR